MDCCQLEDGVMGVKREDAAGNDPENGSPDADRGGNHFIFIFFNISSCYSDRTKTVVVVIRLDRIFRTNVLLYNEALKVKIT